MLLFANPNPRPAAGVGACVRCPRAVLPSLALSRSYESTTQPGPEMGSYQGPTGARPFRPFQAPAGPSTALARALASVSTAPQALPGPGALLRGPLPWLLARLPPRCRLNDGRVPVDYLTDLHLHKFPASTSDNEQIPGGASLARDLVSLPQPPIGVHMLRANSALGA